MKLIFIMLICSLLFVPTICAQDESIDIDLIDIQILHNEGISQYSTSNYTFDCEKATSNILTIIIKTSSGYNYLTILHFKNGTYIDSDYKQLDRVGNVYNIQFTDDGQYRARIVNEKGDNSTYKDFYINVQGGQGTYTSGYYDELLQRGEFISNLYLVYKVGSWNDFQDWIQVAARWYSNPAFMLTDFLMEIPVFFIIPQVWFIIAIIIIVIIWRYRARIFHTRQERELSQVYGNKENLILSKRIAEEDSRLHQLNTMPIDYALEKYGSGDYLSRSVMYHMGVPEIGVTYTSAYSLAFELGGSLFSKDPQRRKRAQDIIKELVNKHEPVLEKAFIYEDIAACARAVSTESTAAKTRLIIKDDFMLIHNLALEEARKATSELSSKLKLEGKFESPLADEIKKIEKKINSGDKSGKNTDTI